MYLKFIGKDGSMGLRYGQVYKIYITSSGDLIWTMFEYGEMCPYSSPQSFAANWAKP